MNAHKQDVFLKYENVYMSSRWRQPMDYPKIQIYTVERNILFYAEGRNKATSSGLANRSAVDAGIGEPVVDVGETCHQVCQHSPEQPWVNGLHTAVDAPIDKLLALPIQVEIVVLYTITGGKIS